MRTLDNRVFITMVFDCLLDFLLVQYLLFFLFFECMFMITSFILDFTFVQIRLVRILNRNYNMHPCSLYKNAHLLRGS